MKQMKPRKKVPQCGVQLPQDMFDAAVAKAKRLGVTLPEYVRRLLAADLGVQYEGMHEFGGDTTYAKTHESLVAQAALMRQARKAKRERELQEALARADELAKAKKKETDTLSTDESAASA